MTSEKILNAISKVIQRVESVQIYSNTYFILGAGQFGRIALEYAQNQDSKPTILVIDKIDTPLVHEYHRLADEHELNIIWNTSNGRFFLQKDVKNLPFLFLFGFPDYFIPAIPLHVLAFLLQEFLQSIHADIQVRNSIPHDKWNIILNSIPKQVVLDADPNNGVILLSWVKEGEICPPNCIAPIRFCPHHNRKKPFTITEIVRKVSIPDILNLTIESHQATAGLGIIKGMELKNLLLTCLIQLQKKIESKHHLLFFVATTCNCHGVVNVFYI
ncbi:MAG: hypothetical protein JW776_13730 [Candidatus Lokiarchaeota archaeon]|nr:hypothetical protein [Candidatus Lokiarchaeota archaeon]